jgi:hypothetical protein
MAAAAAMTAVTAAAGVEVGGFRDAAEFKGLADILGDGLLDALHFVLRVKKPAGDGVFEEGFAMLLKIIYLGFLQGEAGLAFLLEQIAFDNQRVVLAASGVVGQEGLDFAAKRLDFGLVQDGLAKVLRLLDYNGFIDLSLHNRFG